MQCFITDDVFISAGHRSLPILKCGHFIYPQYILEERLPIAIIVWSVQNWTYLLAFD
nr:MAG TPA: hypothetical protein [Caudoviricetes sp.]